MPRNVILKKDRYPGIRSFEAEDKRLFYGRTKEIDDLFSLVKIKPLVVLFGKSGLGKSSLLKAGLGSVLLENHFFPIMIRVQDTKVSPIKTVLSELEPFIDQKKLKQFGGKSTNRIWEVINACSFTDSQGNQATPVLIFDQFEELFNHDKSVQNEWAAQLSDLVEERRPKDVVEAFQKIPFRERTPEQLKWFEPPAVKILFAIRSDRMSQLHQLRFELPAILHNRFELKPLQSNQANEAIEKPAALNGTEFTALPFSYAPETVQEIQSNLSNEAGEIESFQLQIVCQHIEEKVKVQQSDGKVDIIATSDFLGGEGGIQNILKNYYDNHIKNLGSQEDQLAARKLLEEGLIADGRRIGVADAVVKGTFGINDELLKKLLESRLIRPENTRLGRSFEISHDTLVAPILTAYENRRLVEERIAKQKELEEQERQLAIERKKRRVSTMITIGAVVLSLLAITTSIFALNTNATSQKIIDSFYFYGDSLALASKEDDYGRIMYGYINKKGETLINYNFSEALPFDHETGLAKVTATTLNYEGDQQFFLSPNGVWHLLAESIEELPDLPDFSDMEEYELSDWKETSIRALDLRRKKLTTIPNKIFQFKSLRILLLQGNDIENLPSQISYLKELQTLNLSGNDIENLPSQITYLKELQSLNLAGNKLKYLAPQIAELENLRSLDLRSNSLSKEEIFKIKKLLPKCDIDFGNLGNFLTMTLEEKSNLQTLERLDLSGDNMSDFLSEIGNLKNLQSLDLSGNDLVGGLPPDIGNLVNLKNLNLSLTNLTSLPPEIENLKNLDSLNLHNNSFSVEEMSKIKKLLPNCNIIFAHLGNVEKLLLPLEELASLESLDLSFSNLTSLPPDIWNLVNVKSLNLFQNKLTSLPPEIANLASLESLDLGNNKLTILPPEIGQMVNLEELDLHSNKLTSLPPEIANLKNLKTLDLGYNEFSKKEILKTNNLLPNCNINFGMLGYLFAMSAEQRLYKETFSLKNQKLKKLPSEIGQMVNLKELNLSNNLLESLPAKMANLKYLEILNLENNNFSKKEQQKIKKLLPNCKITF